MGALRTIGCILGLPIFLLVAVPIGLISSAFYKGRKITPKELATLLRRIAEDTIDRGEWDEFESLPLRNKRLEGIRLRAFPFCGRPGDVNEEALNALAAEAEALDSPVD